MREGKWKGRNVGPALLISENEKIRWFSELSSSAATSLNVLVKDFPRLTEHPGLPKLTGSSGSRAAPTPGLSALLLLSSSHVSSSASSYTRSSSSADGAVLGKTHSDSKSLWQEKAYMLVLYSFAWIGQDHYLFQYFFDNLSFLVQAA